MFHALERTLFLQWVLWRIALRHVDYTVHVEADLFRIRRPMLVAEAVCISAVFSCVEGVVAGADGSLVDDVVAGGRFDPEINVQVSAATKLSVADLEGHGHLVVLVQLLVEAFSRVCSQLDVVRMAEGEEGQQGEEETEERHIEVVAPMRWWEK